MIVFRAKVGPKCHPCQRSKAKLTLVSIRIELSRTTGARSNRSRVVEKMETAKTPKFIQKSKTGIRETHSSQSEDGEHVFYEWANIWHPQTVCGRVKVSPMSRKTHEIWLCFPEVKITQSHTAKSIRSKPLHSPKWSKGSNLQEMSWKCEKWGQLR